MKWLKTLLISPRKTKENLSEYESFSDFMRRAPHEVKIRVFMEAARRADEDQKEVFEQAQAIQSPYHLEQSRGG